MLSREDRNRIVVVLVRARNPNNIGAVARAMHDFGFGRLRVVSEYAVPFEGTTAVGERVLQHPLRVLAYGAEEVMGHLGASAAARMALLFGSEKTGLSNKELSHCNWLMTIPMEEHAELRHPSMNLGQAVAVCLYELVREVEIEEAEPTGVGATADGIERVIALLGEVLEKAGYRRHHPANCDEADVRRFVVRMGLSVEDAAVWMGMLRQVMWRMSKD
jgi:tRNA C32,U32 (ribose-2'-O)-methylase TrmJ